VPRPNYEALAPAGSLLLRAHCPDERRKSKQYECAVEALRPQQRHTDPFRQFLDGVARTVLVREPVLDVGAPELECNLKEVARALAQPVVVHHPVGVVEAWIRAHVRRWVGCRMPCWWPWRRRWHGDARATTDAVGGVGTRCELRARAAAVVAALAAAAGVEAVVDADHGMGMRRRGRRRGAHAAVDAVGAVREYQALRAGAAVDAIGIGGVEACASSHADAAGSHALVRIVLRVDLELEDRVGSAIVAQAIGGVVARLRALRIGGAHHQGEEDGGCNSRCGAGPLRLNNSGAAPRGLNHVALGA
jgi:hypothetical protein